MAIVVTPTSDFIRELKVIAKKYKSISTDIAKMAATLKDNPTMGTYLGQNIYKIRLSISGTNKGKSGGARVITYVVIHEEIVYLSEIYLKSEHDTVDTETVIKRLKDQGLI